MQQYTKPSLHANFPKDKVRTPPSLRCHIQPKTIVRKITFQLLRAEVYLSLGMIRVVSTAQQGRDPNGSTPSTD